MVYLKYFVLQFARIQLQRPAEDPGILPRRQQRCQPQCRVDSRVIRSHSNAPPKRRTQGALRSSSSSKHRVIVVDIL
jgi:hypothetical protein